MQSNVPEILWPFWRRIQWARNAACPHISFQVCLYLTSFRILWRTYLKGNQKWEQVAQAWGQRGRDSMTPNNGKGGVRINGIIVTPRALSRITLFFTVSSAQTITNSTNETLQYRGSCKHHRQMSAALRCSRQSQNHVKLSDIQIHILKDLFLSDDLFIFCNVVTSHSKHM